MVPKLPSYGPNISERASDGIKTYSEGEEMNQESWVIVWIVGMLFSLVFIYMTIGYTGLCCMFPEGKRWWHTPSELLSLSFFAALIHFHPF